MSFLDVLGAIASPISSVIQGISGAISQDSANETNIQLARENRDWQEKMWSLNNEYNTPANQMKRIKEAGLNPNLMYGQGTVGNSSSPASGVSSPRIDPVNYFQGLTGIQDAYLKMQQAKLLEAQRKKVEGSTVPNDTYLEGFRAKTDQMKQAVEVAKKNVDYIKQLTDLVEQQVTYYGADKSATWNYMHNQIEQAWIRLSQDSARIAIAEFQAQTGRIATTAQKHYIEAMARLVGEKIVAAQRENRIGDETAPGEILRRLSLGLATWAQSQKGTFDVDYQGAQRIFDNLMDAWKNVNGTIDSVIPF